MHRVRRVLGLILLATSLVDLAISITMLDVIQRPVILLTGALGLAGGYMTYRNIKYWTIPSFLASIAYFSYGGDIVLHKLLTGDWAYVVSMFAYPLKDPGFSPFMKLTLLWFNAILPLFLIGMLGLCVVTWASTVRSNTLMQPTGQKPPAAD